MHRITPMRLFILFILLLSLDACKKKNLKSECNIAYNSIVYDGRTYANTEYQYIDNKLTRLIYWYNGGGSTDIKYLYKGDSIVNMICMQNDRFFLEYSYHLKPNKQIWKQIQKNETGILFTILFFYNSDNKLEKVEGRKTNPYQPGQVPFNMIVNYSGNNISSVRYTHPDFPYRFEEHYFAYDLTKKNPLFRKQLFQYIPGYIDERFIGIVESENLVQQTKQITSLSPDTVYRDYTYTFNSNNILSNITIKSSGKNYCCIDINESQYAYFCID